MTAGITGTGIALPRREVTNEVIGTTAGVDDTWIEQRTGIVARRIAELDESVHSLATSAGRAALLDAEVDPGDIDLVLVATCTAERSLPPLAPGVASSLGIGSAGAFDVGAACNGFLSALSAAAGILATGDAHRALVIGSEVMSRITDPADPKINPLFGDGAGAVVLEAGAPGRIGPFVFGSAGEHAEILRTDRATGLLEMQGREVYRRAIDAMAAVIKDVTERAGLTLEDVGLFIPHQANERITRALCDRLELDPAKVMSNIARRGNTSAASVPIALHEARSAGRLALGDTAVLASVGAGLVWSGCAVLWGIAEPDLRSSADGALVHV
ncbi:MAG: 3-oxoacyl-ACP synthase III family protein [Actinomycetota bacterium]